mmetsp:Transcript_16137/g.41085  ORF Transcript_16137/g.41085 Transcript_16137/m.41085 type:complete len:225 (+) Transcript_16137:371-1045(+)
MRSPPGHLRRHSSHELRRLAFGRTGLPWRTAREAAQPRACPAGTQAAEASSCWSQANADCENAHSVELQRCALAHQAFPSDLRRHLQSAPPQFLGRISWMRPPRGACASLSPYPSTRTSAAPWWFRDCPCMDPHLHRGEVLPHPTRSRRVRCEAASFVPRRAHPRRRLARAAARPCLRRLRRRTREVGRRPWEHLSSRCQKRQVALLHRMKSTPSPRCTSQPAR